MILNSIIDTIGNTPIVRLNSVSEGIQGTLLAKLEYFNPGNSSKDRIARKMIEDAENSGILKPKGTIIEGTSGNTGIGLALMAITKGYKCIFTTTCKQSKEKIDVLKALGAEVIVCPTNVESDDPRSYYSVAKKLHKQIPNSFYPNQYDNDSNSHAHYETTGPEIWEQTEGKITHYVATVGTGGSISGTSRYLKEKNSTLVSIGIDAYGSALAKYKDTGQVDENEIYPYLSEGFGEDLIPKNVHFDTIDLFYKVTDKEGAIMARRLAKEEGLFVGWSSGSAVQGALKYAKKHLRDGDVMVIFMPDHGGKYLNKIYNDSWMKDHGFLTDSYATAKEIIERREKNNSLCTLQKNTSFKEAITVMHVKNIDQTPVMEKEKFVGSISTSTLLDALVQDPTLINSSIETVMEEPMPIVTANTTADVLSSMINKTNQGLLVRDQEENIHIITQYDILKAMA